MALLRRGLDQLQDLDAPLVRTIVGLTIRPGVVASEYAGGARRRYTNPIKYALIAGAVMVLGIKLDPFGRAMLFPKVQEDAPPAMRIIDELMPAFVESTQLFMLVSAPLLALLLWAFFPRTQRNYAEQCALVFFVLGHIYLLQTPFVLLGGFASVRVSLFLVMMQVGWLSWAALRFYGGRRWLTFLRASVPHLIYFVLIQISIVVYLLMKHGTEAFLVAE